MTIGVDIGGTKVAAALVDAAGQITTKTRVPMVTNNGAAAGLASVESAINAIFDEAPEARAAVTGIGICAPGPLDPTTGVILNPPNVPCWRDYPLAGEVERLFHVPARVDNDANAACLAEARWGAGMGYRNVFFTILGTGVGTGIVFDGKIYHGRTGSAAEGGHVTIDYRGPRCGCGKHGCIEAYASGPNIARRTRELLAAGETSSILQLAGSLEAVRTEHVGEAFRAGDALATRVLTETSHLLTIWLGTIVDILEPDVMVMGGGVSELMSCFFPAMSAGLKDWAINQRAGEIPLVLARYGSEAGIAGAAALCA
ncbi:MAG TPA: ROK family protein [Candidatus Sulfopaludibacter sp.]|nr:ROK family protein [Candidatus Sulfopaludibacter sp.]